MMMMMTFEKLQNSATFWKSGTPEPRVAGGQEMTYGRSLQRHLAHFNLPTAFTEWAPLAQDRAGWHKLVTKPPSNLVSPSCDNQEETPG